MHDHQKMSETNDESTLPNREDLRDRQSIRTTFRIHGFVGEDLAWLAKHYGITLKDVFDYLSGILRKDAQRGDQSLPGMLSQMLKEEDKGIGAKGNLVRKTYVMSRSSLKELNALSKEFGLSRDRLINFSVPYLRHLTEKSQNANKEKYARALEIVKRIEKELNSALDELSALLSEDDDVARGVHYAGTILMNVYDAATDAAESGIPADLGWLLR